MRRQIALVIGATLVGVNLIACGEGAQMARPKSVGEAVQRTDQLMESGRRALSSDLRFGDGDRDDRSRCEDNSGGQVYATRSLQLMGADRSKFDQYHSSIRSWWNENGFSIKQENQNNGWVVAENADGFTMKLRTNDQGEAYLGVSSPCV